MFKKIILSVSFVLFGFGLFGCATPQTNHNTAHVFGSAKGVFQRHFQSAYKKPSLKGASLYS